MYVGGAHENNAIKEKNLFVCTVNSIQVLHSDNFSNG